MGGEYRYKNMKGLKEITVIKEFWILCNTG